ncbi:MAG: phosphate acetyltransferase [Micrococcales bacterium]|nr:phosphate acetyltransferase [Micrococcales bacterium]MCL2667655.1 phosphate acetyltransferase [Micrococcales bacterium]
MARTIYLAAPEGDTGKSVVALGLLDLLAHTVQRVGIFRPVARSNDSRDWLVKLLVERTTAGLTYDEVIGATYDEVAEDPEAALSSIVAAFHEIESRCDEVLIIGSDYTGPIGSTELAFNARVAANLGAPVVLVVRGRDRTPDRIRQVADVAIAELTTNHAQVVAVVANRCDPAQLDGIQRLLAAKTTAYALPNDAALYAPTLQQIATATHATLLSGDEQSLSRPVLDIVVAGMGVDNLLSRLSDSCMVIVPGDRSDALLGIVMAHQADTFPSIAGVIINGGLVPAPAIARLLEGMDSRLPLLGTNLSTFAAAQAAAHARGHLTSDAQTKLDTAVALFEKHVDGAALLAELDVPRPAVVTPLMFEHALLERARSDRKRIVLPEGEDDRILRAAATLLRRGVADLTILGDEQAVRARAGELGLDLDTADVVDPTTSDLIDGFAAKYTELRAHKGMTLDRAREVVQEVSYFATMMVYLGLADGMVSGAIHTTAHTIKPAFEIIKTSPGITNVSSVFFMCLEDRVLVYGDCAVVPEPTTEQLADIAISSASTAMGFGIDPKVAMLSYSTGASGSGEAVEKVRDATALVHARRPDLSVEGPIQYDAAVDLSVAATKLPGSDVAGRATVFIFPDLNTGNNTYKAVQRSSGAVAVGPVLQGLRLPVNDLSRGALVQDIVNTVAITAIQAQMVAAEEAAK